MPARNAQTSRFLFSPSVWVLFVWIFAGLWLLPAPAAAQALTPNLAEGRVVICVAKDGLVLASIDAQSEAGAPSPAIIQLGALRAGVLLGAVEWAPADSSGKPVRLDSELPALVNAAVNITGRPNYTNAASDIEVLGVSLLERMREVVGQLHQKLSVGGDEPVLRLILADYMVGYGPEAWEIDFHIQQDALGNDYYETHVTRPSYTQLYPPEKGQPHTFLEVRYPANARTNQAPDLIDLLRQNDPRLATSRASNEGVSKSVSLVVDGQSQKSAFAPDADFLRAAIPAITSQQTRHSMAVIDYDKGFQWIEQPPAAERPPTKPQEPGAPTLRRKSE